VVGLRHGSSGLRAREEKPEDQSNHRNGTSGKTVITDDAPIRIEVPRDREGSYEPQLIGKHERRFTGFDQKIISMYARGMTVEARLLRQSQPIDQQAHNTEHLRLAAAVFQPEQRRRR
jgi:hypothetical protein